MTSYYETGLQGSLSLFNREDFYQSVLNYAESREPTILQFATFNAFLSPGLEETVDLRIEPTLQRVAAVDADVMCLQEMFAPNALLTLS